MTTLTSLVREFYFDIIQQGLNPQRENLLHCICRRNQYELFAQLVLDGNSLCQQDIEGRTPIHVAIERAHHKCLLCFCKLLQDYDQLDESIQKDLCRAFHAYNNNGHTILQEAVLHDMQDLVRDILSFCQKYNVQIIEKEVLGCGDSLLHLIVKKNLIQMAKIVCDFFPELKMYENYAGILPQNLSEITQEMAEVLQNVYNVK
uniref:Uncharacterized protein n=1 Tax=Stomoxys calcitrans TaxID=35570 RepID=A0A1I8P8A2_STOCA